MSRSANVLRAMASSWLTLAVVTGTQLVQIPLALRFLGDQEFGLFAVLSQTVTVLLLAELGVSLAFARLLIDARTEGAEKYARMWCSGFALFLLQAGFIALVALLVAPFLSAIFKLPAELAAKATWLFLAAGAVSVIQYPLNIFSLALFAGQRLATSNLITVATTLVNFAIFVASLYAGFGIWSYIFGLVPAMVLGMVWQRWACRRHGLAVRFERRLVDRSVVRSIFLLGTDVFFMGAYNVLMNSGLVLFSGMLLPLEVSGRLAVNLKLSQMVIQVLQRIPGSTEPTLMELVSQQDHGRFRFGWACTAKASITASVAACGGIYFFGAALVGWWTSPAMVLPSSVLALVALLPLRTMIQQLFVSALVMFKKIGRIRWNLAGEAALFTVLALLLGSRYGVIGLLTAHLVSLPLGALISSVREFTAEAGFERGALWGLLVRYAVVPLLFFLALRGLLPGSADGFSAGSVAALGGWLLLSFGWGWVGLRAGEQEYLRQLAGRLTRRLRRA